MTTPASAVPRPLARLFLLALLGVVLMIGLVIGRAAGPWAAAAYGVLAVLALAFAARTAQRRARALARAQGRTCTCCTTSVHDPVKVI